MRVWACASMLVALATGGVQAAELIVRLEGVASDRGSLRVGVFDSAEGFAARREGVFAKQAVAAERGRVVVRFPALPPGRYAVTAFHDLNDNNRLDRLLGLLPREGVALSNNPPLRSRPRFADIAVAVAGRTEVRLRLVYPGGD